MTRQSAPYGSWASPVTSDRVAGHALRFGRCAAAGGVVLWSETRPQENASTAIVARTREGGTADLIPPEMSARSRVHEYGGGEFACLDGGVVFVNSDDQDLYLAEEGGRLRRLTETPEFRFADMDADPPRRRLVAVAERHGDGHMPRNLIVAVPLAGGAPQALVEGADFYAFPRLSPDGTQLAWIEWDLPHMPWENSRLMLARLGADGRPGAPRRIAGGDGTGVFQPQWREDGNLLFVWDESGWGNLYGLDGNRARTLCPREAEFARPLWGLATTAYAVLGDGLVAAVPIEDGETRLALLDLESGALTGVETPLRQIAQVSPCEGGIVALAARDEAAPAVVRIRLDDPRRPAIEILRESTPAAGFGGAVSHGRHVTFASAARMVHAIYYPPRNDAFSAPPGEAPPAIVSAHGGPTGMADRGLKLKIQYWTSRGFAFLDVDYAGSFGYGRAYREALDGNWGVSDVDDVLAGARWLVDEGLADGARLLVSGSSAGGYTVLASLVASELFAAGAVYYGISDLARLAALTHKFESGYIYTLLGAAPDEAGAVFEARSPLAHAGRISSPVIFFQGVDDKVVPPEQSRAMADSLNARGVPVAYLEFEGESHGFRSAATIRRALEAEHAFYARILGLEPAERLPPVDIRNLEKASGTR